MRSPDFWPSACEADLRGKVRPAGFAAVRVSWGRGKDRDGWSWRVTAVDVSTAASARYRLASWCCLMAFPLRSPVEAPAANLASESGTHSVTVDGRKMPGLQPGGLRQHENSATGTSGAPYRESNAADPPRGP